MNYTNLRALIDANIKDNGNQEITGEVLQQVLQAMVTALGAGYQYIGVATPAGTPSVDDSKVFWIACEAGTYTNYGGAVLTGEEVVLLMYGSGWTAVSTGIATSAFVEAQASGKAVLSDVMAALADKASGRGDNPALVAGSARTVLGSVTAPASPTVRRTASGTGAVRITELRGATVEWGGELLGNDCASIVARGRNQWDEQWEAGQLSPGSGAPLAANGLRSKNFIPVIAGEAYFLTPGSLSSICRIFWYDSDYEYIDDADPDGSPITVPAEAAFAKFYVYATTAVTAYNRGICFNVSDPAFNGQYAPYFSDTLALNPTTWTSGGVNLFPIGLNGSSAGYDRAIVDPDGVIRRVEVAFGIRAYEEGDENDPAMVTNFLETVYPLASKSVHTLDAPVAATYAATEGGTEEFSPHRVEASVVLPAITLLAQLPEAFDKAYISAATLENLTQALGDALGIVISWSWNEGTQEWEFTI